MSSAHDMESSHKLPQKRADTTGYSLPGQQPQVYDICNQHGPPLEPALAPLARTLIVFDLHLFRRVEAASSKTVSSASNSGKVLYATQRGEYATVKEQWRLIELGQRQFSPSYLESKAFIPAWVDGLRIVKDALGETPNTSEKAHKFRQYVKILKDYDNCALKLEEKMVDAARQGVLTASILFSIQERWMRLEDVLDWYVDRISRNVLGEDSVVLRQSSTWAKVRQNLEMEGFEITDRKPSKSFPYGGLVNAYQNVATSTSVGGRIATAFTLRAAFFVGVTITIICSALGFSRSSHLAGSPQDADFWFLIQTTTMQLLGLLFMALLEQDGGGSPKIRWASPAAAAGLSSILAVPLYLVVPKEWSAILSILAGGVQSFMALEYFLDAGRRRSSYLPKQERGK